MYSDDKDLVAQFSAYLKVSIKHARQECLVKRSKIKSNEFPVFEGEDAEDEEAQDVLRHAVELSDRLEQGIVEIRLLLDQIENSSLYHAFASLKRQQKEIMVLRIFYMKSFEEIGKMLGLEPKKAENTYYNAIKKIRNMIAGGRKNGI